MSEYIPKYPSKEDDDSNKTSSELLAETLKPIYVPQDLMLAWESHLASYSRDTHVLLDQVKDSETTLNTQYQALLARVHKYEQMLQDITMDSNEFTMDTDEVNFTGWNILAQASYWDYLLRKEITKLSDQIKSTEYKGGLVTEVTDAVLVGLIADNTYISNVIGALSDTPLIRELDAALTSTITSITDLQAESVRLAEKQAADAAAFADQQEEMLGQLVTSIEASKAEQLNRLAEEAAIRTQLLQELEAKTDAITADYNAVVDTLHTTVIQELTAMQDGISASVSELKTTDEAIITSLDAYKVSNGQNIAALQNSVNVVTNTQESIATQVTGLIASFDQIDLGLSKAQADIVTSNQARADGDAALSQQITTINTGLGDANSRIDTVNTAVSTLDTATATKFSELATTLAGVDDSIASVRQIADIAVSNDTAQATEINALKSRMTVTEGDVINKAEASALSSLNTRVGTVEGNYTSQAADITQLSNSLDTTNVNVGTAQTAAQNAMNAAGAKGKVIFGSTAPAVADRLVQNLWIDTTGNANTPKRWNGSTWVVVTDKVATDAAKAVSDLDNVVKTKADVTALNSLTTKVTEEAGKTTANTNSITTLNSEIVSINNNLATKANASALNDIYTKQQTDAKATEVAAGEVSKYDAKLVVGGKNLFSFNAWKNNRIEPQPTFTSVPVAPVELLPNTTYTISTNYPARGVNPPAFDIFVTTSKVAASSILNGVALDMPRTFTTDSTGTAYIHYRDVNLNLGNSHWIQIERGSSATNYVPNQVDTYSILNHETEANATAIETTNAEVTRLDGRVTTESNRITSLTGRVSTVEGAVSTKADASALNSLTTRVATEEGKSTSQGSAITSLQNTINHATTGLSTKASSAALTAVDNKVTAVDGRVTTTNSAVTNLTGRVSTVEGGLTTKADVSAVNVLTTRVGNVEGGLSTQARDITSLRSAIAGTAESITANGSQATVDTIGLLATNVLLSANTDSMTGSLIKLKGQVHSLVTNSKMRIDPTKLYKLRMRFRRTAGTDNRIYVAVINYNASGDRTVTAGNALNAVGTSISGANYPISYELPALNVWRVVDYYFKGKSTVGSTGTGTLDSPRTFPALAATADIGVLANYIKGNDITQEYEIDYLIFEDATNEAANNVNASAITSTNTEVSRINGVVSGHSTQLTNLTATIDGKADTSALNALTARVSDEEGKSSSQSTSITNLNSSVANALKAVTVSDTRSTNQPPSWYLTNYPRRVVNEFKTQTVIGVNGFFGGTYCNLETKVYYTDLTGGDIIQTATSSVDPSLYVQRRSNGTAAWTAWAQPIKDLRDSLGTKASASAVSTLDTKVTSIDGRVTTQASQITTLTSDNDANKNALQVQATVIDGVKANYMVKMETNGVIGGFGLMQSTGALGQVVTTFGVNADAFFIGAPVGGKKPFMVTTANQVVDGITYPAGTYINTALIANATIGTAKIADAAITNAKIVDASIESAKIKSIKADKIEIGNPLVGPITASMVTGTSLTNAANLFNGNAAANAPYATYGTGTQSATSGAETNYIQVDVGSTVSMPEVRFFFRGSTGRKTYIKLKASVDGVNWDYIIGSTTKWETIDDMPPGPGGSYSTVTVQAAFSWYGVKPYRYLRIYGNGSSTSATNELVAIIGNASGTVTKIGSEGILTDSITADKIQVDSLSAISANLGTIQVGTANIDNGAITTAKIGDAQITNAKIGDLQVDTLKIQDNAVTIGVAVANAASLTITTGGGKVRVEFVLDVKYDVSYAGNINYQIYRNGVAIKTVSFPSNGSYLTNDPFSGGYWSYTWGYVGSIILVIDSPTAGTYTYDIKRQAPYDSYYGAINVSGITLTEFKK